jgi:hypothetical protein
MARAGRWKVSNRSFAENDRSWVDWVKRAAGTISWAAKGHTHQRIVHVSRLNRRTPLRHRTPHPTAPKCSPDSADPSIWFRWNAPRRPGGWSSAPAAALRHDNGGIHLLAVDKGSNVVQLTLVAGNDDALPGQGLSCRITFQAVAGTTYRIAIDGRAGHPGHHRAAVLDELRITKPWRPTSRTCSQPARSRRRTAPRRSTGRRRSGRPRRRMRWRWRWSGPADTRWLPRCGVFS